MSSDQLEAVSASSRTVLVVDDNAANLRVISRFLQEDGCRVLTARDGRSALERARHGRPDLILLDVIMPEMDGFEACRHLKADATLQMIPVIFMTALAGVDEKVRAFELGAVDYVTKPFQPEEVLVRVRTHLRLRELTTRLESQAHELAVAKLEAEAANAAKSDFLARMSHDIRTPLNVVMGLTAIVLKTELTTRQRDYLNKVQLAGGDLLQLINDILDFSKVEAGRLDLETQPFELDRLLEDLADLFSHQVAQNEVELIFALAPEAPRHLSGDAPRIRQVLTNLIANAIKFTEAGEIIVGVEPVAETDTQPGQTVLKFTVTDTGSGIAADALPTLFDPFTQADSTLPHSPEGTGLGLAICRRLVELMGGRIRVESTPGRGSAFSFSLSLETRKQDKYTLVLPEDLHGLKTLVADDNETARQVIVNLLESFTFNVAAVENGDKALEALERSHSADPFQLVLLDWKMPGLDGMETARRIRASATQMAGGENRNPQPPIIILVTAYGREFLQAHEDTAAVDATLLKPVKASQLCDTIMQLLSSERDTTVRRAGVATNRPPRWRSGARVLVVEDSPLNCDVAVALLEEAGLIVETAEHGRIAVEMVTGSPIGFYDAVLMDLQMPEMDGYAATKKIREFENQQSLTGNQPVPQTPIIALTANALKGEKEKCLAADMDDYLAKPLDEQALHQVLFKWISPEKDR